MTETTSTKQLRLPRAALAVSCALFGVGNNKSSPRIGVEAFAAFPVDGPRRKLAPHALRAVRYGTEVGTATEQRSTALEQSESKRTLYDVLGVTPDATREELKAQYVALARESHPDAVRGRPDLDDSDRPDFNEVARAWKLLSVSRERMKYDRSLKAERFTEDVENLASQVFDMFAAPLVRRKEETVAIANNEIRKGKEAAVMTSAVDLSQALTSAVRASQAGRAIDRIKLVENPHEQEDSVEEKELPHANPPSDMFASIAEETFCTVSRTPYSDRTSMDTITGLDGLDSGYVVSDVENLALLKETLNAEIAVLEEAERQIRALKLQIPNGGQQVAWLYD